MTTREKILIGFMGAAVVIGAGSFLIPTGPGTPVVTTAPAGGQALMQTVAQAAGTDAAFERNLYVIQAANRPIPGATQFATQLVPSQAAVPLANQASVYSGYVGIGNKVMAIIDGLEYAPGDVLASSGYVIVEITPAKVVLESVTDKTKWEISYSGDDL